MAQSVPVAGAVVVTTPQGVSVSDVRKAVAMFRQLNIPILGVVENMSYFVVRPLRRAHRDLRHGRRAGHGRGHGHPLPGRGADRHARALRAATRAGPSWPRPPTPPAAQAFAEVAGKVAAQISIQNMRVLRVIQTA